MPTKQSYISNLLFEYVILGRPKKYNYGLNLRWQSQSLIVELALKGYYTPLGCVWRSAEHETVVSHFETMFRETWAHNWWDTTMHSQRICSDVSLASRSSSPSVDTASRYNHHVLRCIYSTNQIPGVWLLWAQTSSAELRRFLSVRASPALNISSRRNTEQKK